MSWPPACLQGIPGYTVKAQYYTGRPSSSRMYQLCKTGTADCQYRLLATSGKLLGDLLQSPLQNLFPPVVAENVCDDDRLFIMRYPTLSLKSVLREQAVLTLPPEIVTDQTLLITAEQMQQLALLLVRLQKHQLVLYNIRLSQLLLDGNNMYIGNITDIYDFVTRLPIQAPKYCSALPTRHIHLLTLYQIELALTQQYETYFQFPGEKPARFMGFGNLTEDDRRTFAAVCHVPNPVPQPSADMPQTYVAAPFDSEAVAPKPVMLAFSLRCGREGVQAYHQMCDFVWNNGCTADDTPAEIRNKIKLAKQCAEMREAYTAKCFKRYEWDVGHLLAVDWVKNRQLGCMNELVGRLEGKHTDYAPRSYLQSHAVAPPTPPGIVVPAHPASAPAGRYRRRPHGAVPTGGARPAPR